MARVLDVLSLGNGVGGDEGLLGIVVADWSTGTDLVDLIAEHPLPPATAARLLEPLAAAVERAHVAGLVLGVDHPQRIRVTPDGSLRLAFPGAAARRRPARRRQGPRRDPVPAAHRPLAAAGRAGRDPGRAARAGRVDRRAGDAHGGPARAVRGRAAQPRGHLDRRHPQQRHAAGGARRGRRLGRADRAPAPGRAGRARTTTGSVWTTRPPVRDKLRRRKLAIGVTALAVATVGVLAWVGMLLIDFFGDDTGSSGTPVTITQPPPEQGESAPPKPQSAGPIDPAGGGRVQPRGHRGRRAERQQRHRRRPGHGLGDRHLQAAVPRAQARRRDHGVLRRLGPLRRGGDRLAEPRHGRSRSAPRPRPTPSSTRPR